MRKHTATVIKSGNSYALRISKQYAEDAKLQVGEKVTLPLPAKQKTYRVDSFWDAANRLADTGSATPGLDSITDVVAWQREIREDRELPGRGQ